MTGAAVAVERARLILGQFSLRDIDLTLAVGEILVILGPNGAGKSVCLEMIAGFHRPQNGRIVIGGRDVTALPPEQRRVSLMFQNFGLFPHLTVAGNVGFGRRARRTEAGADIGGLLGQFGIAHLAERQTQDLSPGEKQRVALARALATSPDLFLFDEPFSALDARTRDGLRDDLKRFLRRAGAPAIFVSHDQTDAFLLADRVAVMDRGEILQFGAVADVFRRPATAFVADCVGVENILPGRRQDECGDLWRVQVGERVLKAAGDGAVGDEASLCWRADEVTLQKANGVDPVASDGATNRLTGTVIEATNLGPICRVTIDCGFALVAYVTHREMRTLGLAPGQPVVAAIEAEAIHALPKGRPAPLSSQLPCAEPKLSRSVWRRGDALRGLTRP